jgi:hypothetical protein
LPLWIRGGQGRVRSPRFKLGSPVRRRANRICGLQRVAPKRRSRGVGFRKLFPAIIPHQARQDCRLTKAPHALYVGFRGSLYTRRTQAKPGETTRQKHSTPGAALQNELCLRGLQILFECCPTHPHRVYRETRKQVSSARRCNYLCMRSDS